MKAYIALQLGQNKLNKHSLDLKNKTAKLACSQINITSLIMKFCLFRLSVWLKYRRTPWKSLAVRSPRWKFRFRNRPNDFRSSNCTERDERLRERSRLTKSLVTKRSFVRCLLLAILFKWSYHPNFYVELAFGSLQWLNLKLSSTGGGAQLLIGLRHCLCQKMNGNQNIQGMSPALLKDF